MKNLNKMMNNIINEFYFNAYIYISSGAIYNL